MSFKRSLEEGTAEFCEEVETGSGIKSNDQAVPLESHPALGLVSVQANWSSDIQNCCIKWSFYHIYPLAEGYWIKSCQDYGNNLKYHEISLPTSLFHVPSFCHVHFMKPRKNAIFFFFLERKKNKIIMAGLFSKTAAEKKSREQGYQRADFPNLMKSP